MLIIVSDRGRIYKRSAFIILSYREYEKRRGKKEKFKMKLLHEHRLSSVQIYNNTQIQDNTHSSSDRR